MQHTIDAATFPVPADVRELLVFGGSFDPPTRAHIELAAAAREASGAGWLLYVPAGRSPFKSASPEAGGAERIGMLRIGLSGRGRVSISTYELEQSAAGEPSYTLATLEAFRGMAPGPMRLRLLIGADQAAAFHRWREPHRVIELAEPLVMLRSPMESREGLLTELAPHWDQAELERWRARIVEVPLMDISATRVRELLRDPSAAARELRDLLPDGVLEYIVERGLYGDGG